MFAPRLAANIVLLSIMFVQLLKVSKNLVFDLACSFISKLFTHLFANVTLKMLLSEVGVERVVVIEMSVVAMMTSWMLFSLMFCNLISSIELLFE